MQRRFTAEEWLETARVDRARRARGAGRPLESAAILDEGSPLSIGKWLQMLMRPHMRAAPRHGAKSLAPSRKKRGFGKIRTFARLADRHTNGYKDEYKYRYAYNYPDRNHDKYACAFLHGYTDRYRNIYGDHYADDHADCDHYANLYDNVHVYCFSDKH